MRFFISSCSQLLDGYGYFIISPVNLSVMLTLAACMGGALTAIAMNFYWRNK